MSFWGELKRRNVFKVGAAYVIVAWLILQVVSITFPALHLPGWALTLVTVILIIGFPLALIFAWAFELTADGVKRTSEVLQKESITHVTGRKLNYLVTGLLVVAVAYILFDNLYLDRRAIVETEVATVATQEVSPAADVTEAQKTIAVLPFSDLSPEKDQEYFVDGLSEELLNCLAKIDGLRVTSRTSSFAFKNADKTLQEIAGVLGVDHILEGSVRKAGDALRITAQLIRVKDDSHLWSETYNRELKDIFAMQEDIATTVADELKLTLGIDTSVRPLGGTENTEAYEIYLVAKGQYRNYGLNLSNIYTQATLAEAEKTIDTAIELDPEFALAWVLKAYIHFDTSINSPTERVASEQDAALEAASRAIQIEPNLADAYAVLGVYKSAIGEWVEAEMAFQKAIEFDKERFSANGSLAGYYEKVGYLKKAHEIYEKILRDDPFNPMIRAAHIETLAQIFGIQSAEEEYERWRAMFGGPWMGDIPITYQRLGAYDDLSREDILDSDIVDDTAKDHLESSQEALSALRRIYNDYDDLKDNNVVDISMWAAYFGDPEFSMDAIEKASSLDPTRYDFSVSGYIWYPVMHEVRQMPRFKEFVRKIGLVDYWEQFGWPDLCRPLENGDFECD